MTDSASAEAGATFRDVFASRAYRYLFAANGLSWLGDYTAKAAVTALVFDQTGSVTLSAVAFGIGYLPWLVGGPVLAALAERYRYKTVLVLCDLARASAMALVAIPGQPVGWMLSLLFLANLANPPFQAARSALLPQILDGDRYLVGVAVQSSTGQAAQVVGYLIGSAMAPFWPHLTLLINAVTFVASAGLVWCGVGSEAPPRSVRRHLMRETVDGFRIVLGRPVLRAVAVLVFASMLFAALPEGLAAGWAADLSTDRHARGWSQGVVMMAEPVGFVLGGLVLGRLVRPDRRRRLMLPLAMLAPAAMVPALLRPTVMPLAFICVVSGFCLAGMLPAANGLFVQALPSAFRARAFGVMQTGVQLAQGAAIATTGALANWHDIPIVVGAWCLLGVAVLAGVWWHWPDHETIAQATGQVGTGAGRELAAKAS